MNILFDLSGCNQPYNAITVYGLRILAGFKENGYKDISILCDARIYDHVHVMFFLFLMYFPRTSVFTDGIRRFLFSMIYRGYESIKGFAYGLAVSFIPWPYGDARLRLSFPTS